MDVLDRVKKRVRPDDGKKIRSEVEGFLDTLNKRIKAMNVNATAVLGGSFAKGTYLKDDYDVDIFVKFDYRLKGSDISKTLGEILSPFHPDMVHGSRDYFQIKGKLSFEIVPVLDVSDPKKSINVTDMSPMHVKWARKHITGKIADEIRLAKQFCKAQGVYGAESYISGFSGHVLDILIIYYGSFEKLLRASKGWKGKTVIDINNIYRGTAIQQLNKAKTHSPLVIIDPILPERNAAAALSVEKLERFREAAGKFLNAPDENFFAKEEVSLKTIRKKYEDAIILNVMPLKGKIDVIGGKLLKAYEHIGRKLKENEFEILESGWNFELFWYAIARTELSATKIVPGPPARDKIHSENFRRKHTSTFVKNNRLFAEENREFMTPESIVEHLIAENLFSDKVESISIAG